MFKASEIDWTQVPAFISYVEGANAKMLDVFNSPDTPEKIKNARIADILNSTYFS